MTNLITFPDQAERVERRWAAATARAEARWDQIRGRVRDLCAEMIAAHDDLVLMEIEAIVIEVVGELKGGAYAAGVAEKVAARLRREADEPGAA